LLILAPEPLNVKRTLAVIFGLVVLFAQSALAQYHGGGGGGRHSESVPSGPTPETKNNDLKGFERAVALQATPDQISQFQRLTASTRIARRRAQDLLRLSAKDNQLNWINATYPLTNDLEETQADNEKFLGSFSKEQESGLKKFTKKLRKSDSEIGNQNKVLGQNVDRQGADGEIVATLQKLEKTLADLQSQQLAIAAEMGIQPPGQPRSE
jgi:hypothetical protein